MRRYTNPRLPYLTLLIFSAGAFAHAALRKSASMAGSSDDDDDDDDGVYDDAVPPRFTEMPRDLEVTANGRIALECVAEGVPTPSITWKINNTDFHRTSDSVSDKCSFFVTLRCYL